MNAIADRQTIARSSESSTARWLSHYYAVRALASALWVGLAFTVGNTQPAAGAALLLAYPMWDCLANYVDATRNGGRRTNPTQLLNIVVSAAITFAVAGARDVHAAIGVIGIWAVLSGVLQLSTGVRRWRYASAQWPQILSGGQSCFAAIHFLTIASHPAARASVTTVAPYAAFGALYFAISALVLMLKRR